MIQEFQSSETNGLALCSLDVTPIGGVRAGNPVTNFTQQFVKQGTGHTQTALEGAVVQMQFLEKAVKFTKLCVCKLPTEQTHVRHVVRSDILRLFWT